MSYSGKARKAEIARQRATRAKARAEKLQKIQEIYPEFATQDVAPVAQPRKNLDGSWGAIIPFHLPYHRLVEIDNSDTLADRAPQPGDFVRLYTKWNDSHWAQVQRVVSTTNYGTVVEIERVKESAVPKMFRDRYPEVGYRFTVASQVTGRRLTRRTYETIKAAHSCKKYNREVYPDKDIVRIEDDGSLTSISDLFVYDENMFLIDEKIQEKYGFRI